MSTKSRADLVVRTFTISEFTSAIEGGLHSMLNRQKSLCQYFNTKSGCKFKENCHFLHSPSESISNLPILESRKNEEPVSKPVDTDYLSSSAPLLSSENQNHEAVNVNRNISKHCFSFEKYGNCKFGNKCRYLHTLPSEQGLKTAKNCHDVSEKRQRNQHDGGGRRKICHYFQEGHCQKGDKCRYFHPVDNSKVEVSDVILQKDKKQLEKDSELEVQEKVAVKADVASRKPAPRPGPRRAPHIPVQPVKQLKRDGLLEKELEGLRLTEIEQLKKRISSSNLEVISDDDENFTVQFDFSSTDPDWVRMVIGIMKSSQHSNYEAIFSYLCNDEVYSIIIIFTFLFCSLMTWKCLPCKSPFQKAIHWRYTILYKLLNEICIFVYSGK